MLTSLQERDILFIDEVHRMSPAIEEILYPAMEDYELDILIGDRSGRALGQGAPCRASRSSGPATRAGLLTSPLRARFRHRASAGLLHRRGHPADRPALGGDPRRSHRRARDRRDRAALTPGRRA